MKDPEATLLAMAIAVGILIFVFSLWWLSRPKCPKCKIRTERHSRDGIGLAGYTANICPKCGWEKVSWP